MSTATTLENIDIAIYSLISIDTCIFVDINYRHAAIFLNSACETTKNCCIIPPGVHGKIATVQDDWNALINEEVAVV